MGNSACRGATERTKEFRTLQELKVLQEDYELARTRKLLFLGRNGAGKSTLIRHIPTILKPAPPGAVPPLREPKKLSCFKDMWWRNLTEAAFSVVHALHKERDLFRASKLPAAVAQLPGPGAIAAQPAAAPVHGRSNVNRWPAWLMAVVESAAAKYSPTDTTLPLTVTEREEAKTVFDYDANYSVRGEELLVSMYTHPVFQRILNEFIVIGSTALHDTMPVSVLCRLMDNREAAFRELRQSVEAAAAAAADKKTASAKSSFSPAPILTDEDLLLPRVRTTGIVIEEMEVLPFDMRSKTSEYASDTVNVQLIDVGGPRNERKKWIHCFENLSAVIYVVALDSYDCLLYEDESECVINETLKLFRDISTSKFLSDTKLILVFNRLDAFDDKIKRKGLTQLPTKAAQRWFEDYKGSPTDADSILRFMARRFRDVLTEAGTPNGYQLPVIAMNALDPYAAEALVRLAVNCDRFKPRNPRPSAAAYADGSDAKCPVDHSKLPPGTPAPHDLPATAAASAVGTGTAAGGDSGFVPPARSLRQPDGCRFGTRVAYQKLEATFETNDGLLFTILRRAPLWRVDTHFTFPLPFRKAVRAVLAIWSMSGAAAGGGKAVETDAKSADAANGQKTPAARRRMHPLSRLPRDVLFRVFELLGSSTWTL